MNVLIVEDNASARKLLRLTFEHYGCKVVEAEDGVEGLEQAKCHKPDLIISDALMPRMDGFQLIRAIKSDPGLASIPFIFYSSTYTGDKVLELALSLGAEAFITKPTEPAEIWEKTCAIMKEMGDSQSTQASAPLNENDEHYLREYSKIVATKLEEKVRELEESLVLRTEVEEQLRTLNEELTREIIERKQAEAALKTQEQELATIFENAPFIMLLLDVERRVFRVNGLACSFAGSAVSDIIGRRSGEALRCIHALDAPEGCGFSAHCHDCTIRNTVTDTFETGRNHHLVEAGLPSSVQGKEQIVPVLISTTKVMVADQAAVLLSIQDISEYKRLESQLRHAQKMESIGTLAGGIAHDFNNILTVIIGYGEIALMGMSAGDPLRNNVEPMLQAARRAAFLAQDLLLFSRKQVSEKKVVDLNAIVRSVEQFLLRVIGEDITCSISLDSGGIPVLADAHQLEQVLMNFATNARDAMPKGGSLLIATEWTTLDEAFIADNSYGSDGKYAVLTVTDTGMGMDESTRLQIFDPFFSTKEIGKGTGLGLAIVYGIIKQHDGHITVHSEPGLGTTFRIYLPLTEPANNETTVDSGKEEPGSGTETILLAEDDETVRNMAQLVLQNCGYEIIAAVDGEDAVQKFRDNRERIRLLLFDVIMPKKNGIDAYDQICEIEPGIKIIYVSGYTTDAVLQKALTGDHATLISKPYLPSKLLETVRSILDRKLR